MTLHQLLKDMSGRRTRNTAQANVALVFERASDAETARGIIVERIENYVPNLRVTQTLAARGVTAVETSIYAWGTERTDPVRP